MTDSAARCIGASLEVSIRPFRRRARAGRASFGHLSEADCLETGFASRVDETCGGGGDGGDA